MTPYGYFTSDIYVCSPDWGSGCSRTSGGNSCGQTSTNYGAYNCDGSCSASTPSAPSDSSCPVNGGWSGWSGWSSCTASCGGGTQVSTRSCTNPSPANGGAGCSGDSSKSQSCNTQGCPVNGGWGVGDWGACSVSCGGGTQTRTVACDNPAPANGGAECPTSSKPATSQSCNTQGCPVNGGWGVGDWGACSVSCGGGTRARTVACDNPAPANNGAACPVSDRPESSESCNTHACVYTLTLDMGGTGSGTVSADHSDGQYTAGTYATLTATAAAGSTFTGWSFGCGSSVLMLSNRTCTATFTNDRPQIDTVTITDSVGNNVTATNKANPISDTPIPYTISVSGSDTGGAGNIRTLLALINYQGSRAGTYRGYLGWYANPNAFGSEGVELKSCAGAGTAAIYNGSPDHNYYGRAYLHLVSCSVSDSGDTRMVTFKVTFDPSYTTPLTDNDISGFVYDDLNQFDTRGGLGIVNGWRNFDTNFAIVPPLSATCSADSSHTYSPTTSYTADTFTWKARSADGGTGIYDYSWSGAEGPAGSGSALTPTTLSSANAVVNGYTSSGDKTATLALSSAGGTRSFSCTPVTVNPIPDLIPDDGTLPSYTLSSGTAPMAGESLTFSARVANKGPKATGPAENFRNVIQIRNSKNNGAEAGDTTVARVDTGLITSLNVGAGTNVSAPYTFSDTTLINHGTTFFYRVCANMKDDGTPSITAEVGGNNCGEDRPITVLPSLKAICSAACSSGTCYTTDTATWNLTSLSGGAPPYTYSWSGGPTTAGTGDNTLSKTGSLANTNVAALSIASVSKRYRVPSPPDKTATFSVTSLGVTKSFSCTPLTVEGIADLVPGETG